jgi:predicted membrane protein
MKKATLLSLLLIACLSAFGQNASDSLTIKSTGGGCTIYQNGKAINLSTIGTIIESNELAFKQFGKAKSTSTFSNLLGSVGGFLVGYPVGGALTGKSMDWRMLGIGAALITIAIPISSKSTKQLKQAVNTYNSGLTDKPQPTTEYNVKLTGNGLSFAMVF